MWLAIFQDAFFAAVAAIGFAAISRPPRQAYLYCAITAAVGHALRFILTNQDWGCGMSLIAATLVASFVIGLLAVFMSPLAHAPAETCLFPALLPMIPGIYAYKTFGSLVMCLLHTERPAFDQYFYLFASNGLLTLGILMCMVTAATIPIFIFKRISFTATRSS